jgi:hypothetical protein
MGAVPILNPIHRWHCPACLLTDVTHEALPHTRYHACSKLGNLTVPMLPEGVKAKVEAHEREDYVGKEVVQLDANGRPVQSVITTRDDGQDTTVYAASATAWG